MAEHLIIGAGYAGLAAGLRLSQAGLRARIVEREAEPGGLSRTRELGGVRFDLGPHIFFRKEPAATEVWRELLGDAFATRTRETRIYYGGRLIKSPLDIPDTLAKLGPWTCMRAMASFVKARLLPPPPEENSRGFVCAQFGSALYEMFFRVYNTKIWGLPPEQIAMTWAGKRIKSSLLTMVRESLTRKPDFTTKRFDYPDFGSSMLIDAYATALRDAGNVSLDTDVGVHRVRHDGGAVREVATDAAALAVRSVISSMPIDELVAVLDPAPPPPVLDAARALRYRALIAVNLVFARDDVTFPYHWVDVHDADLRLLRASNFGNYAPGMGSREATGITAEMVDWPDGAQMTASDETLATTARAELEQMGLIRPGSLPRETQVVRAPKAFCVYFLGYERAVAVLRDYLGQLVNLQTVGRGGMYKFNNMHHSVVTGMQAAENVLGAAHDPWRVQAAVGGFGEHE